MDLVSFTLLAFAISWAFFIPGENLTSGAVQTTLIIFGAFGPFAAAAILIWRKGGKAGLRSWFKQIFHFRLPLRLYLGGFLILPLLVGGLHFGLYTLLGGEPNFSSAESWTLFPIYMLLTALLTGGNEEPGWRGYALPRLQRRFHPLVSALILGLIHAAWHLPLMATYATSFGWYLFNMIPLTVLLNWLYNISRKGVFPVMLLHAGINVIARFIPAPGEVLGHSSSYMLVRGLVYWLMAIFLVIWTRGNLGHKPGHFERLDHQPE
jgi:membrane protease YdiL (CAAX protease family)